MQGKNLVGAATRYIAGRNAVQTVYWRGVKSSSENQKFMKVLRTVHFAKPSSAAPQPPARVVQEQNIRF
ncbi:hypothetical protein TcasGA2_TC000791 [Tribolium castaneum]|uniref:Uncharacterized protein n=1 Tax=Tribolium castaneum TaxID=7070 RepID=D6WD48_TRICA|nr:PREDICTED: uncharacterized protein LOC660583 [Tribolium castaneum]EEZ98337.1 hypothetical protein TcasGA2_TC000791 [Tribolium castaneum]|eukprot:XP_008201300.1 PREDICTED: uncharacterized protein LOC660583 [Tribolium castaneum]